MVRKRGVSLSTFYREWRERRIQEDRLPGPILDLSNPNVIRRDQLDVILAEERTAEEAARLADTKPSPAPTYEDLRALGRSDIRARRELAGMTLSELGKAVGISGSQLSQIENGTRKASSEVEERLKTVFARIDNAAIRQARADSD